MSINVHDLDLSNLLENFVTDFIKEKLEFIMREELTNFLTVEKAGEHRTRNGYYGRDLFTRYGKIEDLRVPRDRKGEFQTEVFEPYQRREGWLEEAVIQMYKGGMSTRDVAKFIEGMFAAQYSPTTVSNITKTVLEDVEAWPKRPLDERYSVIYLDGIYVKLRRGNVDSEVVYLAMGINEEGYRQILGFYVGGKESANGWRDVLDNLYERGAKEVLLGVFDGLTGLEEAFKDVYPKADVQRCITHKARSVFSKIRVQDKTKFFEDLKPVYTAPDKDIALANFDTLKDKWGKKYPSAIKSWEDQLSTLLTFYKFPPLIRASIYTSNPIERTNKEIRKRLRPMNSLCSLEAAQKIIYLEVTGYNERWSTRVIRGFGDAGTKAELRKMFDEKYPPKAAKETEATEAVEEIATEA